MNEEQYKRAAEYVAMQCTGCSESPSILAAKGLKIMVEAYKQGKNPYCALNQYLGTDIEENILNVV